jgi:hypothetical protein
VKILVRLPYATEHVTEVVRGESVRVRPFQIVVRVSITPLTLLGWDDRIPHFPAILDTGNNHNFSIRRDHLVRGAGLQSDVLRVLGAMRERDHRLPLDAATIWLHRNIPRERSVRSESEPYPLEVREGITIYPDDIGPRLPVLGLRALTLNRLYLSIDAEHRDVFLRTVGWRTRLLRWLW